MKESKAACREGLRNHTSVLTFKPHQKRCVQGVDHLCPCSASFVLRGSMVLPEAWESGFTSQESLYSYSGVSRYFFSEKLEKSWKALLCISLLSKIGRKMDGIGREERMLGKLARGPNWNTPKKVIIETSLIRDNVHRVVDWWRFWKYSANTDFKQNSRTKIK